MTAIIEDAKEISIKKWGTLNTVASPSKLPDGQSPDNQNIWTDEKPGSVITANGYIKLGEIPSGNPVTGLINFFKTSDGSSRLVVTDNSNVYYTNDFVNYTLITSGLSSSFQLRGAVIRDKLWLTNGADPVMTWDGTTLVELDGTGGTPNVPLGKYIAYHDERVWLYGLSNDLSSLRFTALVDSSGTEIAPTHASAWPTDNEIQISEGDADIGTGIFLYRGYLYASKQYSVWRIVGYDEYTYTRVKTRASTGTRFQESVQIKDNLVHFIGVDGLYTFDGEEATRISDIVDPASSESGVFAFRNLQQPLLNNRFWTISETADFNTGSVPANLSTASDRLTLAAADDSQANFAAGTLTNLTATDNPGSIQLVLDSAGASGTLVGGTPTLVNSNGAVIGTSSQINDGSTGSSCGAKAPFNTSFDWEILFSSAQPIARVVISGFFYEGNAETISNTSRIEYWNGSAWAAVSGGSVSLPSATTPSTSWIYGSVSGFSKTKETAVTDITVNFSSVVCSGIRLLINSGSAYGNYVISELSPYRTAYKSSGKFVSRTLDLTATPTSLGKIAATLSATGGTIQLFTQSSADGSTWDSEVNLSNGAAITSTVRRYIRWGAYFTSTDGTATPTISAVYLGTQYISPIHNTGGGIFAWSAFQMSHNAAGQTVQAYYRAASTSGGVSGTSWTAIVPGAVPGAAITDSYIQFKVEMTTGDSSQIPYVESFIFNWILSSGGINTLQNVASFIWLNRYWLSAATLGASENDVVIILGKSTFESPWHKKDFKLLSFCRFQDYFIAGSSEDGSIYRLEYGYSKNGAALDSYFETADFQQDGMIMKAYEMTVDADRTGPYSLYIGISTDSGLSYTEKTMDLTRESGDSLNYIKVFNISVMSEKIRLRVRTNAADQPFAVNSIQLTYRLSPQRGTING